MRIGTRNCGAARDEATGLPSDVAPTNAVGTVLKLNDMCSSAPAAWGVVARLPEAMSLRRRHVRWSTPFEEIDAYLDPAGLNGAECLRSCR